MTEPAPRGTVYDRAREMQLNSRGRVAPGRSVIRDKVYTSSALFQVSKKVSHERCACRRDVTTDDRRPSLRIVSISSLSWVSMWRRNADAGCEFRYFLCPEKFLRSEEMLRVESFLFLPLNELMCALLKG